MECSNQLGMIGTNNLAPHENILTIAPINIHYLYNILGGYNYTCKTGSTALENHKIFEYFKILKCSRPGKLLEF